MRLRRLTFPIALAGLTAAVFLATVGLISAAYYSPDPPHRLELIGEIPAGPNSGPTPAPGTGQGFKPDDFVIELVAMHELEDLDTGTASIPLNEGVVHTWADGDRTLKAVQLANLLLLDNASLIAEDEVVKKGTEQSIVIRQPWHDQGNGPVFRSASGGELMTLPGGVLLSLDPEWSQGTVEEFFAENDIPRQATSELDFLKNGFVVETSSGLPSLEFANKLAGQEGVVSAVPNWARDVELK